MDTNENVNKFNEVFGKVRAVMMVTPFRVGFSIVQRVTEKYNLKFIQWPPPITVNNVTTIINMDAWWTAVCNSNYTDTWDNFGKLDVLGNVLVDLGHPSAQLIRELIDSAITQL